MKQRRIVAEEYGSGSQDKAVEVNLTKGKAASTKINQWETGKCCRRITARFNAAPTFFIKQLVMADEVWFKGLKEVGKTPWTLSGSRNGKKGASQATGLFQRIWKRAFSWSRSGCGSWSCRTVAEEWTAGECPF